jgi:hypothetical protein
MTISVVLSRRASDRREQILYLMAEHLLARRAIRESAQVKRIALAKANAAAVENSNSLNRLKEERMMDPTVNVWGQSSL